jgi:hypothetical protein
MEETATGVVRHRATSGLVGRILDAPAEAGTARA